MKKTSFLFAFFTAWFAIAVHAGTYYIAPDGNDSAGDGSRDKPWLTLAKAVQTVPDDGSTIIVKDGLYAGFFMPVRAFTTPCTIKAEHPYKARFTGRDGSNRAMYIEKLSMAVFDGLQIVGNGAEQGDYLVQIASEDAHHLVFQNCIFHDSYKNDLLKVNHFCNCIRFSNCLFFNPNNHGGDELFDINTVKNIIVEDSILFNDYTGSGREEKNRSHSFVVIKNSEDKPDVTQYVTFRRNIFLNWSGLPDQAYLLLGEDDKNFFQASDILIENNLFLHNQTVRTVGTFLFKGGLRNVTVRANTVTGEPFRVGEGAFATFAVAFWKQGPPQENILFINNVFCNNAGSTLRFSAGKKEYFAEDGFRAVNNVYWNGKRKFTAKPEDVFKPEADSQAIETSPKLPDVPQKWTADTAPWAAFLFDRQSNEFSQSTIREVFEAIVRQYAVPAGGSSAIGAAAANDMPEDDILGHQRSKTKPDIGCYETKK
jgi:hypothetical protein